MTAAYQLTSDPDTVLRRADNTLVPVGQPTADSRAYAAWLAADNIPDPAPALTPAQQYAAAINAGCQIVSTSTPALNGNYSILPNSTAAINAEQSYMTLYGQFTNLQTTMLWPLVTPAVTFPNLNAAAAVFKALAQYISAWSLYANGAASSPPTQPVTIA